MILDHGYHSYTVTLVLSIGVYDSACIDLCLLSCWNRTSVQSDCFVASLLGLLYCHKLGDCEEELFVRIGEI